MYKGTNPSALRSQTSIKEAMFKLMKDVPYEKLSIKEICTTAAISRQTFYQIFNGKEDVVAFYLDELFKEFLANAKITAPIPVQEKIADYFDFFPKKPEFILLCSQSSLGSLLTERFATYFIEMHRKIHPNDSGPLNDYAHIFIAGAVTQTLIFWLKQKKSVSSKELAFVIENIIRGNHFKI